MSSMNRGFMPGGMRRSSFGKRGPDHRSFGKRGMQHRGIQHRGMQHRGMQHRGMQHRGMQHRGMQHRGMQHRGMQHRGMQHRGMMSFGSPAFGKGPLKSAPKMAGMGNGPHHMSRNHMSRNHMSRNHMGRNHMGRPSGFAGPGNDRVHPNSEHGRGVQSGSHRSRGAGRGSDRGPGGMNRPVDHDQRMEQMKQFFGGQFGNRGPGGPSRGPRGKGDSDNKSERNSRSNMRPDFPQRGPGMGLSFGPPRITNRGFDRRDIKTDHPNTRASRSDDRRPRADARPSRDSGRAPERKPAEKNRKVEVEINGDTGTLTLKGSAEDVKRFQQMLDRANLTGKAEVKGKTEQTKRKTEQTKGKTLNSRRLPSKGSGRETPKEVAPSKTAPESELWNFV